MSLRVRAEDNLFDWWRDMPTRWVNVVVEQSLATRIHYLPVDAPILAVRELIYGLGHADNDEAGLRDILDSLTIEAKGMKTLKHYRDGVAGGMSASAMNRYVEEVKLGKELTIHADTDTGDQVFVELVQTFGRWRHEHWNFPAQTLAGQNSFTLRMEFDATEAGDITTPLYRVDVLQYLGTFTNLEGVKEPIRTPYTREFPAPVNEAAAATEQNIPLPSGYNYSGFYVHISQIFGNYFVPMGIQTGSGDTIVMKTPYDYYSDVYSYCNTDIIADHLDPDGICHLTILPPNGVINEGLFKNIYFYFNRAASTVIQVQSQAVADVEYLDPTTFENQKGARSTESLEQTQETTTSSVGAALGAGGFPGIGGLGGRVGTPSGTAPVTPPR